MLDESQRTGGDVSERVESDSTDSLPAAVPTGTTLCEAELPLSPTFVDFIARWLDGGRFVDEKWSRQRTEDLSRSHQIMRNKGRARFERIITNHAAHAAIKRVYTLFRALCTGNWQILESFQRRFDFIVVIGIPRNGGSYLTGEMFSALGYEPDKVPSAIAHDGFPDARPFTISNGTNTWIRTLLSISEYITAVEIFFSANARGDRVIVPKKLTKAVYAANLFKLTFGPRTQYVITVRHPIASCVSTYEKSGGMTKDRRFCVRSAMEKWIRRDLLLTGVTPEQLFQMDYFSAYIRYWEQFHINLALGGITAHREFEVVSYGKESMEATAARFHHRWGYGHVPSVFYASDGLDRRHPEWIARSQLAIERVASVWDSVGLSFPTRELLRCS
jgi:hypothetical protein